MPVCSMTRQSKYSDFLLHSLVFNGICRWVTVIVINTGYVAFQTLRVELVSPAVDQRWS